MGTLGGLSEAEARIAELEAELTDRVQRDSARLDEIVRLESDLRLAGDKLARLAALEAAARAVRQTNWDEWEGLEALVAAVTALPGEPTPR